MAERGWGAIVSTSTMVASFGQPGLAMYGASRAAIELLTKAWAAGYGPRGVRVNAIAPGPTRTPASDAHPDMLEMFAALAPAGRHAIHVGAAPWALAVTPDGRTVYVAATLSAVAHCDIGLGRELLAGEPGNLPAMLEVGSRHLRLDDVLVVEWPGDYFHWVRSCPWLRAAPRSRRTPSSAMSLAVPPRQSRALPKIDVRTLDRSLFRATLPRVHAHGAGSLVPLSTGPRESPTSDAPLCSQLLSGRPRSGDRRDRAGSSESLRRDLWAGSGTGLLWNSSLRSESK